MRRPAAAAALLKSACVFKIVQLIIRVIHLNCRETYWLSAGFGNLKKDSDLL